MQRFVCVFLVCIMIVGAVSGCSVFKKFASNDEEAMMAASSIALNEKDAQQLSDKLPIYLYFANEDYTKLKLEVRYIPSTEAKKSDEHLAEIIVNELIKGPNNEDLQPIIPKEAQLKAGVKLSKGVATVNFNKAFVDKHEGGKAKEQMTIYSIVNSLTEMKSISQVKFLVEGKKKSKFKGDFKFDNPFPRTTALISKKIASLPAISEEETQVNNPVDEECEDVLQNQEIDQSKEVSEDLKVKEESLKEESSEKNKDFEKNSDSNDTKDTAAEVHDTNKDENFDLEFEQTYIEILD